VKASGECRIEELPWICLENPKYERKGREKHIKKQEKWKRFLPTPWLVLSLIAYILAHWAYLSSGTPDLPDWGQAAQLALQALLPHLLLFLFLLDLERIRPLALSHGIYIQLSRCKM